MQATPEQVRKGLENYIRAWATKDKQLLLDTFAEDGVLEDPVGTPPFSGHANIARFWDFAWSDSSRKVTPVLEEIRACGDQGILRFTMQVRVPDQNAGLNLSIIEHAQFNSEGKLCHLRAFWDENSVEQPEGMALFAPNVDEAYQS